MDRFVSCCLYAGGKDNTWCKRHRRHVSSIHCIQKCIDRKETRRIVQDEQLELFA